MSGSCSRRRRIPSRNIWWSSTMRILRGNGADSMSHSLQRDFFMIPGVCGRRPWCRDRGWNGCPGSRGAAPSSPASGRAPVRCFLHCAREKPMPSSFTSRTRQDGSLESWTSTEAGPGVLHGVVDRLLRDPEERQLDIRCEPLFLVEAEQGEVRRQAHPPRQVLQQPLHGRNDAQIVENGRTHTGADLAQFRDQLVGDPVLLRRRNGLTVHGQQYGLLQRSVVKVAGYPGSLHLLGLDQAPVQVAQLLGHLPGADGHRQERGHGGHQASLRIHEDLPAILGAEHQVTQVATRRPQGDHYERVGSPADLGAVLVLSVEGELLEPRTEAGQHILGSLAG